MLEEHTFGCPYCGEMISMNLDLSIAEQRYVEDCEVCCSPIEIHITAAHGVLDTFDARRGDD